MFHQINRKLSWGLTLAVLLALLLAPLALADTIEPDADFVSTGNQSSIILGEVSPGATLTPQVSFQLNCKGNKHVDIGQTLSISQDNVVAPTGGSLSATTATIGAIPESWPDDATGQDNCGNIGPLNDNGNSTVTIVAPTIAGTYTYNIKYAISFTPTGPDDSNDITGNPPNISFILTVKPSDTTPPAITPTVSGTLGNNGWYTSDVTVSWSVADNESSISSSSGCGPTTISADTAGTTLTCTATSVGGTSSQSVTIKRDATAPTMAYQSTVGTAGANGWFTSDVTVNWSCSDSISGVVATPVSKTVTDEGSNQSATGTCKDLAGNTASDTQSGINIDKTGPSAALAVTAGTAGTNGWYTSDVTVSTSGADSISGPVTCTTDQYQTTETTGAVFNGSCTNDAGLTTNAAPLTVKLDKSGPSASLAVSAGTPGANGWYTSDVTVSTSGSDDISSPVSCTADQFQTTETTGAVFNGSCTNDAGLTTNAAALTVKLDKSGPSASLAVTAGTLGSNGWYTSDVTVSTTGADSISGPVTCTADQYQTTETAGAVFNGSCTNHAGLTTNAAPLTVKLDKTGPSASLAVSAGTPGANGWYTSDVTVSTSGSDDISSPVSCTAEQFQTTETTGAVFNGSCTNAAGLSTNATPLTVKLDKTGPSAALAVTAGTLGSNGWYTSDVTVSTTGADSISSPVTCTANQYQTTETAGAVFNGFCTNDAGLKTDAAPLTVKLDKTGPVITFVSRTPANTNGWNNGDVTVNWSCSDSISGVVATSVSKTVTDEGSNQSATGTCEDLAGNTASDTKTGINIDKTAPTLAPVVTPNPVLLNGAATVTPNATDVLSGLDTSGCGSLDTSSVGSKTVTCTATDKAGNTASQSVSYSVVYATGGLCYGGPGHTILQPINADGSSVFKQKSTVPAKFRVCDANGVSIGTPGVVSSFRLVQTNAGTVSDVDEAVVSTTPDTAFRWSSSDQQWIFNINTKNLTANTTYVYRITLNDGSTIEFRFGLK